VIVEDRSVDLIWRRIFVLSAKKGIGKLVVHSSKARRRSRSRK